MKKEASGVQIRRRDAAPLVAGYSRGMRLLEVLSILVFWSMLGLLVQRVIPYMHAYGWLVVAGVFAGYPLADFSSGFVHWVADTWGSTNMPVLGGFIRPFREHHVDPKAMTGHDYIETNGLNCMITLPTATATLLLPLEIHGFIAPVLFFDVWIGSAMLWIMMTNQFHKWAHLEPHELPKGVRVLQQMGLILSPEHHAEHHNAPFATHYCITSGWLNAPLARLRFFRALEHVITKLTDAVPRRDGVVAEATQGTPPATLSEQVDSAARDRRLVRSSGGSSSRARWNVQRAQLAIERPPEHD